MKIKRDKNPNKLLAARSEQDLPADLDKDMFILKGMALKMSKRFGVDKHPADEIFQWLCELYLTAKSKWGLKPRTIPIRPFVFNNMIFNIRRIWRAQYQFESRDVYHVGNLNDVQFLKEMYRDQENALNNGTFKQYNDPSMDQNTEITDVGYLFEGKSELKELLEEYAPVEQMIIYYHLFLDLTLNTIIKMKVLHLNIMQLKTITSDLLEKLRYDRDLYIYLKESVNEPINSSKLKQMKRKDS